MKQLTKELTQAPVRPIRIVQFGEGNFLRAFVDYMFDILNEKSSFNGSITIVKPIAYGNLSPFLKQECQYTVSLREQKDGSPHIDNRIITSVDRIVDSYSEYESFMKLAEIDTLQFIVSNTTEAGVVFDDTDHFSSCPPETYPGKLTKFLYHRFLHFDHAPDKGLVLLPVELIENNGTVLRETVEKLAALWNLDPAFLVWLNGSCIFCNTLVDRIVTGFPREEAQDIWNELGYKDELLDTAEPFALWVIEPERDLLYVKSLLPFDQAGLPVVYTVNHKPYKTRKVRILNGTQTGYVLSAYLSGYDYVLDAVNDPYISAFIKGIMYEEIIPSLLLPEDDLKQFAATCVTRFHNPYIRHSLLAISLNSVSKWKTRCLPSLLAYETEKHRVPQRIAFSLSALLSFYTGSEIRDGALIGNRYEKEYLIRDDPDVLIFFSKHSQDTPISYVTAVLGNKSFWGQDLNLIEGFTDAVSFYLQDIRLNGMHRTIKTHFFIK